MFLLHRKGKVREKVTMSLCSWSLVTLPRPTLALRDYIRENGDATSTPTMHFQDQCHS